MNDLDEVRCCLFSFSVQHLLLLIIPNPCVLKAAIDEFDNSPTYFYPFYKLCPKGVGKYDTSVKRLKMLAAPPMGSKI